jgi:thioredoxin 1
MLINANTIELVRKSIALNELVMVDIYATWCPPCKALSSVIEQVADLCYIVKVNNDEVPDAAVEFNISGLPTVLFFKNGQELDRVLGLISREALEAKINQLK